MSSNSVFGNNTYHYIVGTSKTLSIGADIVAIYKDLDPILKEIGFFKEAPFEWIAGSIIFQLRNLDCFGTITVDRISKKYMCISEHIYPDYRIFHAADAISRDALLDFYKILSLNEIIAVGEKYNFPTSVFEGMLSKMGSIPVWTEEMGDPILEHERESSGSQYWNDKWMQKPEIVIDLYKSSIGIDTSNDDRYLKFFVPNKKKKDIKKAS